MDEDTRLGHSKGPIYFNQSYFNSNNFELCNLLRVRRKQHILPTTLKRHR